MPTSVSPSPTDIYRCSKPVNTPYLAVIFTFFVNGNSVLMKSVIRCPQLDLFPGARCPLVYPCQLASSAWESPELCLSHTKAQRLTTVLSTGDLRIRCRCNCELVIFKFIASFHPHLRRSMPSYKTTGINWPEIAQENLV